MSISCNPPNIFRLVRIFRSALLAGIFWWARTAPASDISVSLVHLAPAVVNPAKPVVLPEMKINGLRERIDYRDGLRKQKGWGDFLCLRGADLIDNLVFLCEYKSAHPNEQIRIVIWETAVNQYHDGIGSIAGSRKLDCIGLYTSGDELHGRRPSWGDRIYPFFKAKDISTLPVDEVRHEYLFGNRIPNTISGDDENMQVYFAEQKLQEIGATAFVRPATEKIGSKNNLMLIFSVDQTYFVYRPMWGVYKISDDGVKRLGINQQPEGATTSNTP